LVQPQLSMIAKDGKHLLLTASRAVLTVNGNHISKADMSGGLKVDYGEFVLITESATMLPDADQIHATGAVKVKGPGLDVVGIGLSGHLKAQTFELLKEVKTIIEQKPRPTGAKTS
jgi:LPS export ABC transporter protein LptC